LVLLSLPIGFIALIVVGILIYFGLAERVLDRMRLSDRAALGVIALIIAGSFLDVRLIRGPIQLVVNFGGAVVPAALCIWLIATADTAREKVRGSLAAVVTGAVIYAAGRILPADPEQNPMLDPTYVYAIAAGLVAYLAGRSRRAAFIAGTLGVILADVGHFVELSVTRTPGRTWLGGAGMFDTTIIAGLLAVFLAEVVGETRERLQGGPSRDRRTGGPTVEELSGPGSRPRQRNRSREDGGKNADGG
jgi:uncharacterized membrane protein